MLKQLFILLFISINAASYAQQISLNGTWQFRTDQYRQGEEQRWYASQHNTTGWDSLRVPGNWDLENEYADYAGTAWYRTAFTTRQEWKDQRVRLYFESVYNDATVWLNGQKITENHLGFLPFWVDIQEELVAEGENVLVVEADNVFKRGAIWNWGGIRRPVWLEITPMVRLERQHITAVPNLQNGTATVDIELKVSNAASQPQEVDYQISIVREGQAVYKVSSEIPLEIRANSESTKSISFQLEENQVALWHFNHPELYTTKLELLQKEEVIHQLTDRFGIRKVEVDGYQFKLNGETIRTVGFNLVAEDRTTGNTLPLWRIKEDVDLMKSLGANMARLSHLPLPKPFLDYLDERGIMVFEEVSLWGKDAMVDPDHPTPKQWLARMIETKYNHPSIIGWSIGNEIGFLDANPKAMEYVAGAIQQAKQLDPTRLAIYVSHSADKQLKDPVEFSDLIMFNNYGNWENRVKKANELHPGKPIFMAEYGKELNSENPDQASINAQEMLNDYRGKEYMLGASLWTFNDYRSFWKSNPTWTTPPSQNRVWGIVNTFRQPKQPFYTFKKEYAPIRDLAVDANGSEATITIAPRNKLDIPAYPLRGYRLVWAAYDEHDQITEGGFIDLPEITPGSNSRTFPVDWSTKPSSVRTEVHLLDPQDYSVLDTVVYFQSPTAANILSVHTASTKARVVFDPVPNATTYTLRYTSPDGKIKESRPTINHFIEVDSLKAFTEYQFQLLSTNAAGESAPSEVVTTRTDEDELPPVIWATVPADQAFFVGYTVDPQDYLYEVAYGTQPGHYSNTIALRNVGVLKIPNLENGQTYYYRMRLRKQWGFASEWSHEVAITPDGNLAPEEPQVYGMLQQDSTLILNYRPVPKSTGYQVRLTHQETGEEKVVPINAARLFFSSVVLPTGWPPQKVIVALRSKNQYGSSGWVKVPLMNEVNR